MIWPAGEEKRRSRNQTIGNIRSSVRADRSNLSPRRQGMVYCGPEYVVRTEQQARFAAQQNPGKVVQSTRLHVILTE